MDKKEFRKLWVDALRSGEYKQGKLRLNRGDEHFCCLGVACELAVKHGILPAEAKRADWNVNSSIIGYSGYSSDLPPEVMQALGMKRPTGHYAINGESSCLVTLNDKENRNFNEIADLIESEPEGLFIEEDNG